MAENLIASTTITVTTEYIEAISLAMDFAEGMVGDLLYPHRLADIV